MNGCVPQHLFLLVRHLATTNAPPKNPYHRNMSTLTASCPLGLLMCGPLKRGGVQLLRPGCKPLCRALTGGGGAVHPGLCGAVAAAEAGAHICVWRDGAQGHHCAQKVTSREPRIAGQVMPRAEWRGFFLKVIMAFMAQVNLTDQQTDRNATQLLQWETLKARICIFLYKRA